MQAELGIVRPFDLLASANADYHLDLLSIKHDFRKLKSGDLFKLNLFEGILIDSAYQNKALRDCIVSVFLKTYLSQPPLLSPAFQATHRY